MIRYTARSIHLGGIFFEKGYFYCGIFIDHTFGEMNGHSRTNGRNYQ